MLLQHNIYHSPTTPYNIKPHRKSKRHHPNVGVQPQPKPTHPSPTLAYAVPNHNHNVLTNARKLSICFCTITFSVPPRELLCSTLDLQSHTSMTSALNREPISCSYFSVSVSTLTYVSSERRTHVPLVVGIQR